MVKRINSEMRSSLLDYLNYDKYVNAYIISAIFNHISNFHYEVQLDKNNNIKGIASIWEEDKAVTLRGKRGFCRKWFNKLCDKYDFYDLEESLIYDLMGKDSCNLFEKKILYYLIMTCNSNRSISNGETIDYKSVYKEEWNKISQLYYEKYNIEFTDFQPQNMKWLVVYDKEDPICNICLEKVDSKIWVLSNFYTAPHMRNIGIGTKLLKSILKDYSKNEFVLFVNIENKRAIELYKRLGFKKHEKVGNIEL
ncbi:GNAT family N-acetyltransferase [Anaeromicrobium sediminis]|uniref:N-acetyltransferase domain-containing protein n=1 Tax=Anaeromicrobium sediminis TaxID=1478221 RepID=A0A267MLF8_9FIRM|nr:GNAT family N-acetyltransferase [Anaeromicrobium sediminis]PAB60444.1 hypothetical protein CCE28_05990 [Anaeromicrobium sediminis]